MLNPMASLVVNTVSKLLPITATTLRAHHLVPGKASLQNFLTVPVIQTMMNLAAMESLRHSPPWILIVEGFTRALPPNPSSLAWNLSGLHHVNNSDWTVDVACRTFLLFQLFLLYFFSFLQLLQLLRLLVKYSKNNFWPKRGPTCGFSALLTFLP
jgi:hypothetical protein